MPDPLIPRQRDDVRLEAVCGLDRTLFAFLGTLWYRVRSKAFWAVISRQVTASRTVGG